MKDLDFLRLKELKKFIQIKNEDWNQIIINMSRDIRFLQDLSFMDYSLLMSIRKIDEEFITDNEGFCVLKDKKNSFADKIELSRQS